jgi:hypothetical protein
MENPGVFTLTTLQIDQPKTALVDWTRDLDGMSAVTLQASFHYGSGGTNCSAIVVTSLDGGQTQIQIARFDFTAASAIKTANLSGLLSKAVATYSDLNSEGVNDGLLGDRLAVKLITTGTYSGTVLSVRAAVR